MIRCYIASYYKACGELDNHQDHKQPRKGEKNSSSADRSLYFALYGCSLTCVCSKTQAPDRYLGSHRNLITFPKKCKTTGGLTIIPTYKRSVNDILKFTQFYFLKWHY